MPHGDIECGGPGEIALVGMSLFLRGVLDKEHTAAAHKIRHLGRGIIGHSPGGAALRPLIYGHPQKKNGVRGDHSVIVEQEYVVAPGRSLVSDVAAGRKPQVLTVLDKGYIPLLSEILRHSVGGCVIHHDKLQIARGYLLVGAYRLQALLHILPVIVGDYYHRHRCRDHSRGTEVLQLPAYHLHVLFRSAVPFCQKQGPPEAEYALIPVARLVVQPQHKEQLVIVGRQCEAPGYAVKLILGVAHGLCQRRPEYTKAEPVHRSHIR